MWLEFRSIVDTLSVSPDVRAIIISGAGDRAFTSGLDVQAAGSGIHQPRESSADAARVAAGLRRHIKEFQACITAVEECEKPIIVAMHGYSLGLAIDLSSAADVRLCASDTKFAVKEVDIGLAADIGTLSRLPKIVGNGSWVKEVCLTARIFDAEEALRVGFVSAVYKDKQEMLKKAEELACLIASKSPVAVQGTKELLNWSRDRTVADGTSLFFPSEVRFACQPASCMLTCL